MITLRTGVTSALIVAFSATCAFANCGDIPNGWPDGTWLFRTKSGWRPIAELSSVVAGGGTQTMNFAYVANESALRTFRRGVVVVKTGLNGTTAKPGGQVRLARSAYGTVEQCETNTGRLKNWVSGQSYDNYHDFSYRVDGRDDGVLKAFHVSYAARGRGCKRSDDDTTDSYFAGRWQSNRSQFSFDPEVVSRGQYSQFLAQFRVSTAYAETASERSVQIKRYAADETGRACVLFKAVVRPGGFVRVNDIERRIGLFRAPEQVWNWSRAQ